MTRRLTASMLCILALVGTFAAVWMSITLDSDHASAMETAARTAAPMTAIEAPDEFTLVGPQSFLDGIEARTGAGLVNVVVEIPAGSVDKWEVDKNDGALRWEFRDGKPRKVKYLGYPGNYGMIPRTLLPKEHGGDGDPLDVIVLGPAVARGSIVKARIVGVLRLLDDGEQDDKLVAVLDGTSMGAVEDMGQLQDDFPGVTDIVQAWFANYKGVGVIETLGFHSASEASNILDAAIEAFESGHVDS